MGDEDLEVLQKVLRGEPAYVGVIASRKRFDQVRETLIACGVPRAAVERVAAPGGPGHRRTHAGGDRAERHGADRAGEKKQNRLKSSLKKRSIPSAA